jgi:hypothetical protein
LAFAPDGTPFVGIRDGANNGKATVMNFTNGTWSNFGNAGFSSGYGNEISLGFSPEGTPGISFINDNIGGTGLATMMQYISGGWTLVGTPGYSGPASFTKLAFAPDGTPYVAYRADYGGGKAEVLKFSNGTWSLLGNTPVSITNVYNVNLTIAPDGTPYVAYNDMYYDYKATVMKYTNGTWSAVGGGGFTTGAAYSVSLAISPDGTPFLAYRDAANGNKATVMKFSEGTWVNVGDMGFSAGSAKSISLAIAPDKTPYLVYSDESDSNKASAMKFSGGAWVPAGNSGFSSANSYATTANLVFAPDGTPYVAYSEEVNNYKAIVMKLVSATLPTATTGSAGEVTAAGATLNGTVNDNGSTTTVSFDYGLTTDYGSNHRRHGPYQ